VPSARLREHLLDRDRIARAIETGHHHVDARAAMLAIARQRVAQRRITGRNAVAQDVDVAAVPGRVDLDPGTTLDGIPSAS
jgi:hypothetical protein